VGRLRRIRCSSFGISGQCQRVAIARVLIRELTSCSSTARELIRTTKRMVRPEPDLVQSPRDPVLVIAYAVDTQRLREHAIHDLPRV
jgi:hypothetical protein